MAEQVKYLVRIANTDLDGSKGIAQALRKIKGVSFMYANMICKMAGVERNRKAGTLLDAEVRKLEEIMLTPEKFGAPEWLLNRRKEPETGEDHHLVMSNLTFQQDNDLKMLKKMKTYKGVRHMFGLTVRGQRTKSKHRRNKSRGKGSLGVKRNADAKKGRT